MIRLGDFTNRATTKLLVAWASAASLPCVATTTGPGAHDICGKLPYGTTKMVIFQAQNLESPFQRSISISSVEAFNMFSIV